MNRKALPWTVLALGLGLALLAHPQAAPGFKVVVNAANPSASLRRSELANLFLKKTTRWPQGGPALPVDQSATSAVRAAFSKQVLGRSVDAVLNYWQQQIFSGRDTPPRIKVSDEEVLAFVGSSPGAVGYVTDTAALPDGVKLLKIAESD